MTDNTTKSSALQSPAATAVQLLDDWFDPIEAGLRDRVREFIQTMIESELEAALSRPRYGRRAKTPDEDLEEPNGITGHRHGHRSRSLLGTFGRVEIAVPRARLDTAEGKTTEWRSTALRAYQRRTKQADSLIAGAYLAGTNTRRVRRALSAVFGGAVGKDTVSRVWRKVKGDWDAWNARSLAEEPIVRLILDGTVVRVRLDRKATSIMTMGPQLRGGGVQGRHSLQRHRNTAPRRTLPSEVFAVCQRGSFGRVRQIVESKIRICRAERNAVIPCA